MEIEPTRREPPIFVELPKLRSAVPWRPLLHGPTAVEPCLSPLLPRDRIYQKRDDRSSPLYGGNKIRRFEFVLADAEQRGARSIVTVGGIASTQVMATVLFGRRLGFEVHATLFDQPITTFARNALLTTVGGGGRVVHGGGYVATTLRAIRTYRRADRPYFLSPGASEPLPVLGYVDAMFELAEQVRRGEAPRPDIIVVPTGSGGTLAGLALGVAMLGWPTVITGVRITAWIACNRAVMRYRIAAAARFLARHGGARVRAADTRFTLHHDAIGPGYGYPTPEAVRAIPEVERLIGVPGEVTYSAKGLTGLASIARENPRATILYWHTLSSVAPDVPAVDPATLPPSLARVFAAPRLVTA